MRRRLLDVGCGAGNYSLKLLTLLPNLEVTLVDLSRPMLDRAVERVSQGQSTAAVHRRCRPIFASSSCPTITST